MAEGDGTFKFVWSTMFYLKFSRAGDAGKKDIYNFFLVRVSVTSMFMSVKECANMG